MKRFVTLSITALFMGSAASAGSVGFDLGISADGNVPVFSLTNTSDSAMITGLNMFIGDLSRNFDSTIAQGGTAAVVGAGAPFDTGDGGLRVDNLIWTFSGFDSLETFSFKADFDPDNANVVMDYRSVLFPNGSFSVSYSTGKTLVQNFDTAFGIGAQSYSVVAAVPLPASLPLILLGVGALSALRRRKG
ncbi:VPLPA-CTERM protein sorting domain-containing protein [Puniceibacterium sediminis]|uniref:VPLPA-CTERM protein sorting domain-containing protein n=2 Tax=Puniceibacterium sediminis TaxID=1608407 RepID=A0A238UVS1_9RHOB|nr:VPLPA-CTERM protein sorting domain-containing protein [Puniceibacterium sediminis]